MKTKISPTRVGVSLGLIIILIILAVLIFPSLIQGQVSGPEEGDLVRTPDNPALYLIQNSQKRVFPHAAVYASWGLPTDFSTVKTVSDLSAYLEGEPVPFRDGSLFRGTTTSLYGKSAAAVFYVENGKLRPIKSSEIYQSLFKDTQWKKVVWVPDDLLDKFAYPMAEMIEFADIHPDGTLVRYKGTAGVYLIENGKKRPITSIEIFNDNRLNLADVIEIESSEIYETGEAVKPEEEKLTLNIPKIKDGSGTAEDVLEKTIPGIKTYPKFEQTAIDLYSSDGFSDTEIKFIKAHFDIFKLKTNLHQADEEILAHLVSNRSEPDLILSKNYAVDMDYFIEEVIPLVNNITEGSSGDRESVEKIILWVRENIDKDSTDVKEDRVEEILEKRATRGLANCDQYATLITAFCRASGIPAREVSASLEAPGHALIEVYADGKWIAADSTGFYGLILGDEEIDELGQWLHTAHVYNPLDDRIIDVSLSYNKVALNSIIEYTKEIVGEITAIRQAKEILGRFNEEQNLAKKYVYAQDIINICNREILTEKERYNADEIKVIYLWDFDKISKEENFFDELKNIKAISIYDITNADEDRYTCRGCAGEFPLEKFSEVLSEIKPQFSGKIYSFLAHYKTAKSKGSINVETDLVVSLLNPKDTDILQTSYQDIPLSSYELLRDLAIEISTVIDGTKDSTTFYLPKTLTASVEYEIKAAGHSERLFFLMLSKISLQNIEVTLETEQIDIYPGRLVNKTLIKAPVGSFSNLRVINEKDEIYADPRIYGGSGFSCSERATMLWSISLWGGQTLEIWREGDVVLVKGIMRQPQSETIKKYSDLLD